MNYLKLTPLDSWFFRDGRPFHQGEASADVESIFPPTAFTVVGAIRAYLAGKMGWRYGRWNEEIARVLGDGYNLGSLRFKGPYLGRETDKVIEPLFPVPLHLLGKFEEGKGHEYRLLSPGEEIKCDLGRVRLPTAKGIEGFKTLTRHYITAESLAKVLQGQDITDDLEIFASKDLWDKEYAVGLARDELSRTAKERYLYSSYKIRLNERVCLLMGFESWKHDLSDRFALQMGGEGRIAIAEMVDIQKDPFTSPNLQLKDGRLRFTVTHITPAWLEHWPKPGDGLPGIPGKVVSACLERALRIGGWDSVKKEPVPLKPFIRTGSTWFCEADENSRAAVLGLHGSRIGEYSGFGFGEIAIGAW